MDDERNMAWAQTQVFKSCVWEKENLRQEEGSVSYTAWGHAQVSNRAPHQGEEKNEKARKLVVQPHFSHILAILNLVLSFPNTSSQPTQT